LCLFGTLFDLLSYQIASRFYLTPRLQREDNNNVGVINMLRFSRLGFLALFGSILIFLLQSIVSLTSKDFAWKKLRFVDVLNPKYYSWMNDITILNFNTYSDYILNMPLYAVLFCLTVLFFIMSGLFEK